MKKIKKIFKKNKKSNKGQGSIEDIDKQEQNKDQDN